MSEFAFIQSKLDEVKYEIQTSASTAPAGGSASPKVGANQVPADEALTAEEQKELEKKVTLSRIESTSRHARRVLVQALIDRLDTYFEDSSLTNKNRLNIVSLPPPFKPIPCKPVLFDLALNHVTFPTLDEKVQSKRPVASPTTDNRLGQQQQQAGLSGFVKGLFSWSGKNQ